MKPNYNGNLISRAKELRKNATKQENHLWYDYLSSYPVKFQRQRVVSGFIADFYCAAVCLAVELDGSQHYTDQGLAYDNDRSAVFERLGIKVIRFSNEEIKNDFEGVCESIDLEVQRRISNYQNYK